MTLTEKCVYMAMLIVERHRRQIELSPGVGVERQTYGLDVCDDILSDLKACAADAAAKARGKRV